MTETAPTMATARETPKIAGQPVKRAGRSRQSGRLAHYVDSEGNCRAILPPVRAIRAKCLDCCCGSWHEVRLCPCDDCALWPWRMGRRPRPADVEGHQ